MKKIPLCNLCDLPDGDCRGIDVPLGGTVLSVFVIARVEKAYAYLNRCPHTGGPLDWLPHRFLDVSGQFILCATHGAVFRIEDGLCIEGPGVKQRLQGLHTTVERGVVTLLIQNRDPRSTL